MKPARKLHLYTLIMILIGAGALALGGQSLAFTVATISICALNWLWFLNDNRRYLSDWVATAICGAAFLLTLVRLPAGNTPLGVLFVNVPRAGEFLLMVQWTLLFRRKTGRDYGFVLLMSFMLVVCSALLVPDIIFVVGFLALLFVGQCAMSLLHVAIEEERAGRPIERAATGPIWRTGGSFLGKRALATVFVLAPIALIFAVLPRGSGAMPIRAINLAQVTTMTALTGFSDTVSTAAVANVIESTGRVMEVVVTIDGKNAGKDYPLLLRGTAFAEYDPSDWSWKTGGPYFGFGGSPNVTRIYADDFGEYLTEPGDRVSCDILLEPLNTRTLFAPFGVEKVEIINLSQFQLIGNDRADCVATRALYRPSKLHYTTVSRVAPIEHRNLPVTTYEADMADAAFLRLPPVISGRVRNLSRQVADARGDQSDLAKARRIDTYLRDSGKFNYSLQVTPPPEGAEPVDYFLFTSKEGFCTHFAAAMTVMLRCAGIPSRLVTGFKGGTWNSIGEFFTVRQSDAHSWVEAYVRPYGWVTFDPTGRSEAERQPGTRMQARVWDITDYLSSAWTRYVVSYDRFRQVEIYWAIRNTMRSLQGGLARLGMHGDSASEIDSVSSAIRPVGYVLIGVLILGGGTLGIILWTRRRRHVPNAVKFYEAMLRLFQSRGLVRAPDITPVEFAGVVGQEFPDCSVIVREITEQFCLVRYGGRNLDRESETRLTDLVQQLERKARNNHQ